MTAPQTNRSQALADQTAELHQPTGDRRAASVSFAPLSPAEIREASRLVIRDITNGRVIVATLNNHISLSRRWSWIAEHIALNFECHVDDVDCIETDDGDVITADGKPVAYTGGYRPLFQMLQAAE